MKPITLEVQLLRQRKKPLEGKRQTHERRARLVLRRGLMLVGGNELLTAHWSPRGYVNEVSDGILMTTLPATGYVKCSAI